jgi:N-acetylneuraminate synthase
MIIKKFGNLILYKHKPTIIAEAGVNHSCNLKLALKYIDLAKEAGVDAIKFQTYKAQKIVSKISPAYWDETHEKTKSQYRLFKKYDKFNYVDYKKLYIKCKKKKIAFMTSLFDVDAVNLYDKLLQVYKISSSDINNIPLLRQIGEKKKYTIISTGASTIKEIKKAIKELELPRRKICIMHCILNYPTKYEDVNLNYITTLKKNFPGYVIGYSDHTYADNSLVTIDSAYRLGAQIIEKHFTHNKNLNGNDHYHSADKKDFENFYKTIKIKDLILGKSSKNLKKEIKSINFARRSIFAKKDIFCSEKLNIGNLIALRPGNGISVSKWDLVLKRKAIRFIPKNKKISWKDLD